ncbi:MAG: OmpA family protein [Bryobacterales bacterium]|nr:OmpA family protein [Bryobacterales bacterium]
MTNFPRFQAIALGAALLTTSGCATKRYVLDRVSTSETKTTARIGEVEKKTSEQLTSLEEKQATDASRLGEIAKGADVRAGEALQSAANAQTSANQASQRAGEADANARNAHHAAEKVNARVDNLGNLRIVASETVLFRFASSQLTDEELGKLDALADKAAAKFHVVEVHGFTDSTGNKNFNLNLSRQRAEAVVRYLTGKHNIPLHRIQLMGFGEKNAAVTGVSKKEASRLSRCVDVKVFAPGNETASVR